MKFFVIQFELVIVIQKILLYFMIFWLFQPIALFLWSLSFFCWKGSHLDYPWILVSFMDGSAVHSIVWNFKASVNYLTRGVILNSFKTCCAPSILIQVIHYKISGWVLEISWIRATSHLLTLSDIKELVVAVSNGMRYSNGFPKENKTFTFHVNTTTSFSDWRRVIGSYSIPRKSLYYGQAWLRSWSR